MSTVVELKGLSATPTHQVIKIFFNYTDLPPDLIGVITGYYDDWVSYEEIEELKNQVVNDSRTLSNLWYRTFSSYHSQSFMIDAFRNYLTFNDYSTLLCEIYRRVKTPQHNLIHYRTHQDIAGFLDRLHFKTLTYWRENEIKKQYISNKYAYRYRFRAILNKEIVTLTTLDVIFQDIYMMSLDIKILSPAMSDSLKQMYADELRQLEGEIKRARKDEKKIKRMFSAGMLTMYGGGDNSTTADYELLRQVLSRRYQLKNKTK